MLQNLKLTLIALNVFTLKETYQVNHAGHVWCAWTGVDSRKIMKPAIMDLGKWAEKTAQAVRRICSKKEAPCVGFGLVFFDPMASDDKRWNFTIELAFDPQNPPKEEERKNLEMSLEYISAGIQKIMNNEEPETIN